MDDRTPSPETIEMDLRTDMTENIEGQKESSEREAALEEAIDVSHPDDGPSQSVPPPSLITRLSKRRAEIPGSQQYIPLRVKIINNAFMSETRPLVTGDQSYPAPSSTAGIGGTFPINDPSKQNTADHVLNFIQKSQEMQTPGCDTLTSAGSGMTTSSRHGTRRHIGKVQGLAHEEAEKKKKPIDKLATATIGLRSNVANWFGVGDENEEARKHTLSRWRSHVERVHTNSSILGGYKKRVDTLESVFEHSSAQPSPAVFGKTPQPYDPLARGHRTPARQYSRISLASSSRRSGRGQPTKRAEKDPVWRLAFDGVKGLMTPSKLQKKPPSLHSRSIMPNQMRDVPTPTPTINSVFHSEESSYLDDVFFDSATPTSAYVQPFPHIGHAVAAEASTAVDSCQFKPSFVTQRPVKTGWRSGRSPPQPAPGDTPSLDRLDYPFRSMERIDTQMVKAILKNPKKRQLGKGFAGFLTDAEYRKSRLDSDIQLQMAEMDDHRPFFTYWVTFVQVVCYIIAISVYKLSTIGISETKIEGEALMPSLAIESVSYIEEDNMWIGPRQADLIHLGAKYSPCMRKDANIEHALAVERELESHTACCIRDDGSGCVQTLEKDCSKTLSDFITWNTTKGGPYGWHSGSVCGQDPRYCSNPKSMPPYQWPDNISKWPHCKEPLPALRSNETRHMSCSILGRPCCTGIQGQCLITTREHCTFLRGYFYQNHTLCSQISCMNEICGMVPFVNPDIPDQFYRLFISLFIHAGLLQLIITVVFQIFVMRDLEKLAGSLRIGIIYFASGIAGSLSSAIFLPYHVEAGPSGSQFGLLACLFVEIIQNWYILSNPGMALAKLGFLLFLLFIIGLLPMVDNYAHLIGFVFGFFLSFALLPYITFNLKDKRGKIIGIIVCLVATIGLFIGLIVLFYVSPVYNCPHCHYFNCIPFTPNFCKSMEVQIRR